MPTVDVLTEQVDQGGLFMDEQKILLKLADVLLEENLINANERVELMKLICNGRWYIWSVRSFTADVVQLKNPSRMLLFNRWQKRRAVWKNKTGFLWMNMLNFVQEQRAKEVSIRVCVKICLWISLILLWLNRRIVWCVVQKIGISLLIN